MQTTSNAMLQLTASKAYRNFDVAVPVEIEHRLGDTVLVWSVGLRGRRRNVFVFFLED